MPLGHSGYYIPTAWMVWLEFLSLLLLAGTFMQMLRLESVFRVNRDQWLVQIRQLAQQLRQGRRQVENIPVVELFGLIQPFFRGLWKPAFWVLRSVLVAKSARP